MSTVRVGSNEKYAVGWDKVFGGASPKKAAPKKASPRKAAKKKPKSAKK